MAFDLTYFNTVSAGQNKNAPTLWSYLSSSDAIATIAGSGYFDSIDDRLKVGDVIQAKGSDAMELLEVTAVSPNVTTATYTADVADGAITAAKLATNAVTTVKITDANVTLAKLAAGITPSHITKFAGKANNGGGSATVTISSLTGVTSSDIGFASIQASTNAVSVQKVTCGTDQLVVLLSGDPGASTVIQYNIMRAVA